MPKGTHALIEPLATLFGPGTCAGMTDGELLERFRRARDEGGERAFEVLVARHGPMVLGICRRILDDPNDVHDAFQAVFLVLARRAGAIRKSESVGSWLYGVAVRLAARARASAVRRRIRERRELAAASDAAMAHDRRGASPDRSVEHDDGAAVVHEEVVRLPESYRAPIVLCYFEGLTHDEAAARLSWPVGTVRSRLARARDRLRTRLTRRGVAVPSTIGPMAAWLIAGVSPATVSAALSASASIAMPANLPASLARAAARVASGQSPAAGAWSSASIAMADGVLKTMTLKKLALAGCLVLTLGTGAGTGIVMTRGARGQDPATAASTKQTPRPPTKADVPDQPVGERLLARLIASARQRVDAQRAYYEEGRLTIDRFIAALSDLKRFELLAAKSDEERGTIRRRHVQLLAEVLRRERAELNVGRGTVADVAEAQQALAEAEFEMFAGEKEDRDKAALLRRIADLEREVEQLRKGRHEPGRP